MTPPSTPTGLSQSTTTTSSVRLNWNASTDNVGVTGYELFRDGALVTTVTGTNYTFTGLTIGTTYTLGVRAYDAANNKSSTATLNGTTTGCTPDCAGKQCGDDGCSGSCGTCVSGFDCTTAQLCQHPDLVGHWPLDEGSGTSTGDAVGSDDGTLYGQTSTSNRPSWIPGLIGTNALSFNALGKVNLEQDALGPVVDGATGIAISAWIYRDGPKAGCSGVDCRQNVFYSFATNSSGALSLRVSENEYLQCGAAPSQSDTFRTLDASKTMTSNPSWDGAWHHVVCVFNFPQDDIILYFDGANNAQNLSVAFTATSAQDTSTAGLFEDAIGGGDAAGTDHRYFRGDIDQVKLFTKALTASEVVDLRSEGTGDTTAPSTPTGLSVSGQAPTSLTLNFNAATDYFGVTAYDVYLNGALAGTVTGTKYKYNGLAPVTTYTLGVRAKDAAGNQSTLATVMGTTL